VSHSRRFQQLQFESSFLKPSEVAIEFDHAYIYRRAELSAAQPVYHGGLGGLVFTF
jgi:hypothetical protein